jgi:hypothetical protein
MTTRATPLDRCLKYLAKLPDAISGSGGHDATYAAACICWKFGLDEGDAWTAMQWWNKNKCGKEPWTDKDLRHKLTPLMELAAKYSVAIVAVNHLRKGEGPAMYRTMGSLGFVAAARAAYAFSKDKDDPTGDRRFMLPIKNNVGNDKTGLAYRLLAPKGGIPAVAWEPVPITVSADEALSEDHTRHDEDGDHTLLEEAKTWLRGELANGPVPANDIISKAKDDGIAKRTLDRAKKALKVTAAKGGFDAGWTWRLPGAPDTVASEDHPEEDQDPGQETLATLGEIGNLRESSGENSAPCDTPNGDLRQGSQGPESGNVRLDPDKPGPVDLLTPEQHKRYLAIRVTRPASMSETEKRERAWRAVVGGEKEILQ